MAETENKNNMAARLEALLFIYGEPMSYKKIAEVLTCSPEEAREAATKLETSLRDDHRGLFLIKDNEKIQLTTKPEFGSLFETIVKEELKESLTPAALETLAIIAYCGPVSRAEIDYIRGVNSSFTLRNLAIRGLVAREIDPKRANAYIYKPSFDLLKYLGISKAEDLPEYLKFNDLMQKLRAPESQGGPETKK